MNIKFYRKIVICAFVALLFLSIVGKIIETSGIVSSPQTYRTAQIIAMTLGLILFYIIGFALIPLVVRFFVLMQIKIGNSEHPTVKFLIRNETRTVYGFWIFYMVGSVIALPAMIYDMVLINK